ncbi:MAG: polysaccharide deacetylase family protein [Chloroflexi bacterium]|nr:polysaccharide deacetylase family protein [Chloroflexota bacterium]
MSARILFFIVALALGSCTTPTAPVTTPPPSATIPLAISTPRPTFTSTATIIPTITPTPTAFVTPPALGQSANIPILMYHNLKELPRTASELERTWTVSPQNFEKQIAWLAEKNFNAITMAQLVAHFKRNQPLPSKPIVISFDDGWVEQYTVAFAILKKYNLSGTFFIYTTPIDRNRYLSWAQIKEMSAARMDIQAHTLTHPHLVAIVPGEAQREISESKRIIESKLNQPVVAFAYPFGEYNSATIEMLKRAGIASAVTLASGYRQRADELFTLHRIRVSYDDSLDEFAKRLP